MSKFDPKHSAFLDSEERKNRLPPNKIISLLGVEAEDTVLDLGAGTGFLTFPLSEIVEKGKVYAVDIQEEMLKELEKKCDEKGCENIEVLLSQEGKIQIEDEKVNKSFLINVLHEIEDMKTFDEIDRVMKSDGEISVVDWDRDVITERGPPTHERLTLGEAVELLEEHGFMITDKGKWEDHYWMKGEI
ncbi:MAG: class I SAM-dependent methyltransferase [Candidatus Thermoplasmatota archaeon]